MRYQSKTKGWLENLGRGVSVTQEKEGGSQAVAESVLETKVQSKNLLTQKILNVNCN